MTTLKDKIRNVPDFPKPGILFYDITTLLRDPEGLRLALDAMAAPYVEAQIDLVVGMESRGFIFGAALADRLNAGFVPVRKPGKLPWEKIRATYELEYGSDALEIHADAFAKGARVIVLDDVLATGGTAQAKVELVEGLGGEVVGALFVIELAFLHGRDKLPGTDVHALIAY